MRDTVIVDVFSATAVPVEMMFNSTTLSIATGFIWIIDDVLYLVTNWHNLSGRDFVTGANLSPTAGWPNRVSIYLNTKGRLGEKFSEVFDLFDQGGNPNWLVHPAMGRTVDVAALPLRPMVEPDWYAMNDQQMLDLSFTIGQDVFILGYPFGIGTAGYPIWKRPSVASEPEVLTNNQQYILVDTASRPGMPGSPVIRRSWGTHLLSNGGVLTGPRAATRFIGIYSGRLHTTDQADAQLGRVWPAPLIGQIIVGGVRDCSFGAHAGGCPSG